MQLRRADRARVSRLYPLVAVVAFVHWAAGCQQVDVIAEAQRMDSSGMDAAIDAASDAAADAVGGDAGDGGVDAAMPPAPCPYRLASDAGSASVAEIVAAGLERAMCACTGYSSSGELTVDVRADVDAGSAARHASVGVNDSFDQLLSGTIAGSLVVAGGDGISLGPDITLELAGELATMGPLEGAMARVGVGGDARVGGRIDLFALEVAGALTQTPGESMQVASDAGVGELRSEPVQVAPPCACDAASLLDVSALVREAAVRVPELPDGPLPGARCAEYWLEGGSVDALALAFSDSAALYVRGDLHLSSATIGVAPGAALDVFVEGNVFVTGGFEIASVDEGPVRLHVGGTGTIDLAAGGGLHGVLYAPNSELVLSAPFTVTGAVLARRVAAAATLTVHYDASSLEP